MISGHDISLAAPADAARIAILSRDLIEHGLGWRWTPPRIVRAIRDPAINVAVARDGGRAIGFGLMQYKDDEAHLLLLGVDKAHQRRGVGSALLGWLEASALTAGIGYVYLEARATNVAGLDFYRRHGYRDSQRVPDLYAPGEDGVRLARDLWSGTGAER